jgi:hypothetical protein
VTTLDELQAVQGNLSAHYVLSNNINASETETWNSGAGFTPLGNYTDPFSGNFDGQGYTVDGLYINRPNTNVVGLFGSISTNIKNIGVTNIDIQGRNDVGGLVGYTKGGDSGANIMKSYSSGAVSGNESVGGLVGENTNTTIEKSYTNSNVSGNEAVGGLVGEHIYLSNIMETYSTGSVTGNTNVGGLVGETTAGVAFSYWNTETSNQSTSAGSATGLTTAEMTGSAAETNMVDLDFTGTVSTVLDSDSDSSADSYPILDSVDRKAQLVSADVYEAPTYTVDVIVEDSEGTAISGATVDIDGTDGAIQDLADGTYTITASADSYDTLSQDVTVDGANKTVTVTLSESTYSVDVSAVDSEGNAIDNATITIDGTETSTSDLTDGEYNISADATGYDLVSDTVVVDGSSESISLTLSETEYAVDIVVEDVDGNVVDSANVTFDGMTSSPA